jgi:hypothetical protein
MCDHQPLFRVLVKCLKSMLTAHLVLDANCYRLNMTRNPALAEVVNRRTNDVHRRAGMTIEKRFDRA